MWVAAEESPTEALPTLVDACVQRYDAQHLVRAELVTACPNLAAVMDRARDIRWLNRPLTARVSRAELENLQALLTLSRAGARNTSQFDYEHLPSLLADVYVPQGGSGVWEAVRKWLSDALENSGAVLPEGVRKRLQKLIPSSDTVAVVVKLGAVLILLMAVWLVVNEVRGTWVGRKGVRTHERADPQMPSMFRRAPLSWERWGSLPLERRPGALLRLVQEELAMHRALPADPSRTSRECLRELQRQDKTLGRRYALFNASTEPAVYGARRLTEGQTQVLRQLADTVLTPLRARSG